MLKNKIWLGIFLSIILLIFSINGFTSYYKYTQESGDNFYVGTADKSDALEDTNEMRQIIDDLGALLAHSKRDGEYPKGGDFGGTIQIPEAGLKFSNAPANNDIAAYIAGEMSWQTKAELGLDLSLYYLKTEIDTLSEVETIYTKDITDSDELATALADYYLKTEIDTLGEVETIYSKDIIDSTELATALTDYYLKTTIDTQGEVETIWGVSLLNDITGESIGDLSNVDLTNLADNKILKYNSVTSKFECEDDTGGGGGAFTDLTDTPANYTDQAGKYVKVNAGETALEFGTGGGGASQLSDLSDVGVTTPTDKYVLVADGDSWESRAISSDDLSDVDSIAMLDENETVTNVWKFKNEIYQEAYSDFGGTYWGILRARDGDPTYIVQQDDVLGYIQFSGARNETPSFGAGGGFRGVADETFTSTSSPMRFEIITTPSGTTSPILRFAIDNAGNIKMGDGVWTNYVKVTAGGAMTAEGTATIKATDLVIVSQAAGDILYFNGTNWIRLAKGTAGQVLTMNAGGTAPEWQTP